jgi:ABC-type multidrug transport system fused ATPase/permease subunit
LVVQSLLDRFNAQEIDITSLALWLAVLAGTVLISKSALNIFLTRRVLRFLANRQAVVSGNLAARLLSQPLLVVQKRSSQETAYALTAGVNFATLIILGQGVVAVTEASLLVVLTVGLLAISPSVTIFAVAFFALVALLLHALLSGWAGRMGQRAVSAEVASFESIQEALRTYREVVVSNRRSFYVERFQRLRWEAALVQSDLQFMGLVPKYVFEIALVVGAALLAASQFYTRDAVGAVTVIALFLAAGSRVVPSMLRLQAAVLAVRGTAGQASPTYAMAEELAGVGNLPRRIVRDKSDALVATGNMQANGGGQFQPTVRLVDVSLSYPGSTQAALEGVSLAVRAGSSLALVGPTGAGKSTLADVILGVLKPDSGSAFIGGVEPADAIQRWPGSIAYVPQDVALTNGTVRDNVALGLPTGEVNDEWVWEALQRARLDAFLDGNREGLETLIGENGVRLSGGQRQRLGIARALYAGPSLLVLDEATSALDAETEQAVARTLQDLAGTVTTITVAHRLATIRHCDLVAYLEGGRLLAIGSFEDVRAQVRNFDRQADLLGL